MRIEDTAQPRYATEALRVLRPDGGLFPHACLSAAGERNDIDEAVIRRTFALWRRLSIEQDGIPSDTRDMDALIALLERPSDRGSFRRLRPQPPS